MNESEGTSTAVATIEPAAKPYRLRSPIVELLNKDGARAAIEPMLRPGESYERVVVEVYHAAVKNPEILKCSTVSIVGATARAVGTGLIIGETVHLVPYGTTLEMLIDYKGLIQLVVTSGAARYLDAQNHYANDLFEYEQGTAPFIRHRPVVDPKARGELVGAYAVAKVTRNDVKIVYMSVEEIDAIRLSKSKAWKKGPLSAIPWYPKKTVIKQLAKLLPKNPELARVMALFDREDLEAEAEEGAEGDQHLAGLQQITSGAESGGVAGPDTRIDEHEPRAAVGRASAPAGDDSTPFDDPDDTTPARPEGYPSRAAAPGERAINDPPAERKLFAVEEERCPMGPRVGYPLWMISSDDLLKAYEFARTTSRYKAFTDAAESVLENRRNGDLPEPTEAELALPKPPLPKAS